MQNILNLNGKASLLKAFLTSLKVPNSNWGLKEKMKYLPNAHSLMDLGDILHDYNVENMSIKIEISDLVKIETPYIAKIDSPSEEFVIVTQLADNQIEYINEKGKKHKEHLSDFEYRWSGIVLLAEPNTDSKEKDFSINRQRGILELIRVPFLLTVVLSALFYFRVSRIPGLTILSTSILYLLFFCGTIVSVLLLIQMSDKENSLVSKICGLNKKSDCNSILESSASKLFGVISWSSIGFVYFSGSLLSVTFIPNIQILIILNILTLPYTVWSIYYQWKIANQWCILCLCVQALLWVIFIVDMLSGISLNLITINSETLIETLFCFAIPISFIWFIIPFILKAKQLSSVSIQLNSIKFNNQIFDAALQAKKSWGVSGLNSAISFGNSNAEFVITLVTNPYCNPCGEVHRELQLLLERYRDFVNIQILFAGNDDAEDERNKAIRTLINLYLQQDTDKSEELYAEWFDTGKQNLNDFITKHSIHLNNNTADTIFESHMRWCIDAGLKATPTIYINNHELPAWYEIKDLKHFIKI